MEPDDGLDRTYEELKHLINSNTAFLLRYCLDRTYEELKLENWNMSLPRTPSLDRTYEELKPASAYGIHRGPYSLDRTYEELKLFL